jgi:hypothetical protein
MRTIIAGSRTIKDYSTVEKAITESQFTISGNPTGCVGTISEIVSGGAVGVDRLGEQYACKNNIPVKQFIPDWSTGRGAGYIRNTQMAEYADALIAVWDGESRGTLHMINEANRMRLKVYVYRVSEERRKTE